MNSSDTAAVIRPVQPAHWGLWGTVAWGAAVALIFVLAQTVTLVALVTADHRNASGLELAELIGSLSKNGNFVALATFVTTLVCGSLVAGVIKLKRGSVLTEYLGLRAVPLRTMLKWIGLLVCVLALSDLAAALGGRPIVPDFMSSVYATASPVWTIWVALIIAAPVFEEAFFRGFLFRGFEATRLGPVGAVILTAGLWAVIHLQYDAYDVAVIFGIGLLFGAARVRTRSLLVPLALHAVTNLVATMEAAILR